MKIETIKDLEKQIIIIMENINLINPSIHFPIENYSGVYNDIFEFWEYNKRNTNISDSSLKEKIEILESLKKPENHVIKLINKLEIKFNNKKINKKINMFIKIITFGIINPNKNQEKKIQVLNQIKQIKQQNLVKINELKSRIVLLKNNTIKNINSYTGCFLINQSKPIVPSL